MRDFLSAVMDSDHLDDVYIDSGFRWPARSLDGLTTAQVDIVSHSSVSLRPYNKMTQLTLDNMWLKHNDLSTLISDKNGSF